MLLLCDKRIHMPETNVFTFQTQVYGQFHCHINAQLRTDLIDLSNIHLKEGNKALPNTQP